MSSTTGELAQVPSEAETASFQMLKILVNYREATENREQSPLHIRRSDL